MDRFIDNIDVDDVFNSLGLKSNMDRFIVLPKLTNSPVFLCLKYNMDRFIEKV